MTTIKNSQTARPSALDLDNEAFRASLAPFHDEHVRDRYWHAACPQCAAEEAAQLEAKAARARSRKARHGV
jgi:hypothetical protein